MHLDQSEDDSAGKAGYCERGSDEAFDNGHLRRREVCPGGEVFFNRISFFRYVL